MSFTYLLDIIDLLQEYGDIANPLMDIGSVDHFGYLWLQKMPEVGNLWNLELQFMGPETAGHWRFMALSFCLFIFFIIFYYSSGLSQICSS